MLEQVATETEVPKPAPKAKETWVKAYEQGNRILPQTHIPGIALLTLSAVLREPPETWTDFSDSELTTEQLKRIGRNMSRMHRNVGVDLATQDHAKGPVRILTDWDLQGVWTMDKGKVTHTVKSYINSVRRRRGEEPLVVESSEDWKNLPSQIDAFFADPQNAQAIGVFGEMIKFGESFLLDDSNTDLIKLHRRSVVEAPSAKELLKPKNRFSRKIFTRYYPPKFMAANILKRRINDALEERFPDEDTSWLRESITQPSKTTTY